MVKPIYNRRKQVSPDDIIVRVGKGTVWASPFDVGLSDLWFVKRDGVQCTGYFLTSEGALDKYMELYEAYIREMLRLNPGWLDPLRAADYLVDGWGIKPSPASVLCEVINDLQKHE